LLIDSAIHCYAFDKVEPIRVLSGHSSFVYAIAALPDGGVISSGEDKTLRVWSGECNSGLEFLRILGLTRASEPELIIAETDLIQTIPHPSTSLWSCAVVPTASGSGYYIASSSNDGMIRFFTRDPGLIASQAEREAWEKDVRERQLDK
jgi:phospholipase A-2-activating protein